MPLALQTRCGRLWGKEPAAEEANPVGYLSGDTGIGLAAFSYKLCVAPCLQTQWRLTIICLICPAAPQNSAPRYQPASRVSRHRHYGV